MKIVCSIILLGLIGFFTFSLWSETKSISSENEYINQELLAGFDEVISWQPGKASLNLIEIPQWKTISQKSGADKLIGELNKVFSDLGVSKSLKMLLAMNSEEFILKFSDEEEALVSLFKALLKVESMPENGRLNMGKLQTVLMNNTGIIASNSQALEQLFAKKSTTSSFSLPEGKLVWYSKNQAENWFSRDEINADGEARIEFKKRNGFLYGYCFIEDSMSQDSEIGVNYSIWDFQLPGKPQSFTIEPFPIRKLTAEDVSEVELHCNCDVKTAWKSWNTHQVYLFEQDGLKFYGIQALDNLPASSGLFPFIDDGAKMYKGYQIQQLISGADVSGLYSDMFGREVSHFVDFEEQVFFFSSKDDAKSFVNMIQNKTFELIVNDNLQELLLLSPDYTQYSAGASGVKPIVFQFERKDQGRYYHALWKGEPTSSFTSGLVNKDTNATSSSITSVRGTTAIKWETKLDAKVVRSPFMFTNHYTKANEIALVTDKNQLILLDGNGKVLWSREVGEEIIGDLHQVDLYRNNKFQLVFSTRNKLFAVDRNGKNVENFPIVLSAEASAPVSVMDYDGKKKYRFLVPLKSGDIVNYDKDGKEVRGWKHKKEDSPIISKVQHMIIGRKDYLVSAKENGKVAIYKRDGKTRYTQDLSLSNYGGGDISLLKSSKIELVKLLYLDTEGNLVQTILSLDQIDSDNLGLASAKEALFKNLIDSKGLDFTLARDERLALYNEDFELKFAIDFEQKVTSALTSFVWSKNSYIGLVTNDEIQVVNTTGELLEGFPVYGKTGVSFSDLNRDGKLEMITSDDSGLVICYEVGL